MDERQRKTGECSGGIWPTLLSSVAKYCQLGSNRCRSYSSANRACLPSDIGRVKPTSIDELLKVLRKSLPRAMHPLTHRRKGHNHLLLIPSTMFRICCTRCFVRGYQIFALSKGDRAMQEHAGRMDFRLPDHRIVLETEAKFVVGQDARLEKSRGTE